MIHNRLRNSLLNWFPKIRNLGIPVPETDWVYIPHELGWRIVEEASIDAFTEFKPYLEEIKKKAEKIGYPVFIRTDQASGKHFFEETCLALGEGDLYRCVRKTIEFNLMADILGLPYRAIVIREYLELYWGFKAFPGNLPIAKERRYFIKDGEVLCHHPYWPPEAIAQAHRIDGSLRPHRLPANWLELLLQVNKETPEEVELLSQFSKRVAEKVEGYWSIDYALSRDGETWYLIDMADGHQSYHPPNCPNAWRGPRQP